MTDDLISRADAMTELQMCAERYTVAHEAHGFGTVEWCENLISASRALEILRNLPPVDEVPVRHGRWVYICMYGKETFGCNQCGEDANTKTKYCPNCGARMDEE